MSQLSNFKLLKVVMTFYLVLTTFYFAVTTFYFLIFQFELTRLSYISNNPWNTGKWLQVNVDLQYTEHRVSFCPLFFFCPVLNLSRHSCAIDITYYFLINTVIEKLSLICPVLNWQEDERYEKWRGWGYFSIVVYS